MQYLSRRYGVYRLSDGQYLLSTMTAGVRHLHLRIATPRKFLTMAAFKKVCCRYRSIFLIVAVLSASQGQLVLTSISTLLLVLSIIQYRHESKAGQSCGK